MLSTSKHVCSNSHKFAEKSIQASGEKPLAFLFYAIKKNKNNYPRGCFTGGILLTRRGFFIYRTVYNVDNSRIREKKEREI
jgi:hypothetical protein